MAKKIKTKHTEDTLDFDIVDEQIDQYAVLNESRLVRFEKNEKEIQKAIDEFETVQTQNFETAGDDQQIMLLSRLYQFEQFTGWLIGKFLHRVNKDIKAGKKANYNNMNEYFIKNTGVLGFGKSAGYNYMNSFQAVSIEDFGKLGVKKTIVVAKIKDEDQRKKVVEEVKKKKMDEVQTKEYVENLFSQEKEEKQKEKIKVEKKIDKSHPVDIILDEQDVGDNEILIRLKNEDERDRFNTVLLRHIRQFKIEMDRL